MLTSEMNPSSSTRRATLTDSKSCLQALLSNPFRSKVSFRLETPYLGLRSCCLYPWTLDTVVLWEMNLRVVLHNLPSVLGVETILLYSHDLCVQATKLSQRVGSTLVKLRGVITDASREDLRSLVLNPQVN